MSQSSYETVPFEGQPIPASAPGALALTSRFHGGPMPRLEGARVLEIACGDGGNLLPLAAHRPGFELVGIDSSARAIQRARDGASTIGLTNVRFEEVDLAAYAPPEQGFDFVLAHGVYSWVDAERRAALRRLIRSALAPSGLAYVSFNAEPAWSVRGKVRDVLVHSPSGGLDGARARLSSLREALGSAEEPWLMLLSREVDRALDATDAYLAHEYLEAHNDAFWLSDVVRDFGAVGLRYVGDSSFDRREGWVHPSMRERASKWTDDGVMREELIDLLAYRQMRCAVLAREDAPMRAPAGPELLDEGRVACVLSAQSDPFDPSPSVSELFRGPYGTEVRVESSVTKIALLILADRYPMAFTLDDLSALATAVLYEQGIEAHPREREDLKDGLWSLWQLLEAEVRLEDVKLRTQPSARPLATALTRYEAAERPVLTTALHTALPLEPLDREIVKRLDGTRTPEEVCEAIVTALESGELSLEGVPSLRERVQPVIAQRVSVAIETLALWGLVG